ncbi:UDP-2,4-diacetamido-2,4, 6-trideoxy-beta-L-altropyranose hydrolase [Burkholderiales bacterium]|nr:UDP-2,4-diacetamido-2,4, 6-trideoxy-beta-L-altropyranose hydrolase [Burkholderiales bacterium]
MNAAHIILRADATRSLGLGHVKRCLALGLALRECGAEVSLVFRRSDVDVEALARESGIACQAIGTDAAWQEDAAATARIARSCGAAWVVVDHYGFDARWHGQVAAAGGIAIAAIDDLADRPLEVSLLVDPNHAADHRSKYSGRLAGKPRMLAGPRYALLAPVYAYAPRLALRDEVASIGIFMGGADAAGMSTLALEACRHHARFDGPIEIATTRASPHLDALQRSCASDSRLTLTVDVPNLAAFFARHDLQIGAGGGATWERCCLGAPTLALRCAANQDAVIPALAALGAVAALPGDGPPTAAGIGEAVRRLIDDPAARRRLAETSRAIVDGRGAQRVALYLCAAQLHVRPAVAADARMLHLWRNDEATRAASIDSAPIPWERHAAWFDKVLTDPARALLVGVVGTIPVGAIRFDTVDAGAREVSLYLDPALHGLGLGTQLLRAGERHVIDRAGSPPGGFVATVLDANAGSQRLFAAASYRRDGSRWHKACGPSIKRTP